MKRAALALAAALLLQMGCRTLPPQVVQLAVDDPRPQALLDGTGDVVHLVSQQFVGAADAFAEEPVGEYVGGHEQQWYQREPRAQQEHRREDDRAGDHVGYQRDGLLGDELWTTPTSPMRRSMTMPVEVRSKKAIGRRWRWA